MSDPFYKPRPIAPADNRQMRGLRWSLRVSVAGWIVAQGLRSPALLFIETAKPLALIGGQALLVLQPLLGAFGPMLGLTVGEDTLSEYVALLEDSASIDRLLERLEARRAEERGGHESNVT